MPGSNEGMPGNATVQAIPLQPLGSAHLPASAAVGLDDHQRTQAAAVPSIFCSLFPHKIFFFLEGQYNSTIEEAKDSSGKQRTVETVSPPPDLCPMSQKSMKDTQTGQKRLQGYRLLS